MDEAGELIPGGKRSTAVSAKTDFLKKTSVSVNLMAYILYLWLSLKSPLNRIANSLSKYGINLSRQQLYKDVSIIACMLRPVFEHLESYLKEEKQLVIDETYHSCREKRRRQSGDEDSSPPDTDSKHKAQKSASKTMRTYIYGIVGAKICLYYHEVCPDADVPRQILTEHGIKPDTFVETDGFYRKSFNQGKDGQDYVTRLFEHGVCWVHCKRYFCILENYATLKDGKPIKEFINCKWEQDIEDARRIMEKISEAFHTCNEITRRCKDHPEFNIVELKIRS